MGGEEAEGRRRAAASVVIAARRLRRIPLARHTRHIAVRHHGATAVAPLLLGIDRRERRGKLGIGAIRGASRGRGRGRGASAGVPAEGAGVGAEAQATVTRTRPGHVARQVVAIVVAAAAAVVVVAPSHRLPAATTTLPQRVLARPLCDAHGRLTRGKGVLAAEGREQGWVLKVQEDAHLYSHPRTRNGQ